MTGVDVVVDWSGWVTVVFGKVIVGVGPPCRRGMVGRVNGGCWPWPWPGRVTVGVVTLERSWPLLISCCVGSTNLSLVVAVAADMNFFQISAGNDPPVTAR